MDVILPDGTKLTGVPEGTTKEQIKQKALEAGIGGFESNVENYMRRNAALDPEYGEEASFVENVGRGMMDVYQGGKQLSMKARSLIDPEYKPKADAYSKKVNEELELYNKNNPGISGGRIVGNIATPLSLLPVANTYKGLAAAGGLFGLAQPASDEDYWSTKAQQAAVGSLLAPALPAAGRGIVNLAGKAKRGIQHLARPFSDKGITKDLHELFWKEAGGQQRKIASALENPATYLSKPTSGQAIADAARLSGDDFGSGIVRLEADLAKRASTGQPLRSTYSAQEQARKQAIADISGTAAQRAAARSARSSATRPLYDAAKESQASVDTGPLIAMTRQILRENPSKKAITRPARQILSDLEKNARFAKLNARIMAGTASDKMIKQHTKLLREGFDNTPRALMSLSKQIKDMSLQKVEGVPVYDKAVLGSIKGNLDEAIGVSEDAYRMAQQRYEAMSAPVNRMAVGEELAKSLRNASDVEAATTFTNAIRNVPKTMKRATGVGVYRELGDVLTKSQVNQVKKVTDELLRAKRQLKMKGDVDTIMGDLERNISPRLPAILERSVVIANNMLKWVGQDKSPEYRRVAMEILEDPNKLIQLMKNPPDSVERQIAEHFIGNLGQTIGRGAASEAARQID